MHLALRNFHSSPPEFLFGTSNPGLVGPPPLQLKSRPARAGITSPLPLRAPASSGAHLPVSRPLAALNSPLPPSMDSSRPGPGLDHETGARDPASAFNNDPSSGSDQRQGSAEAGPSNLASAPGYAQPRRRASRAGTRSVTTLSASQLERKRANDREAQRAIRARTKEHIEKLERRLLELTSQGSQSEQLLASIKRQRELEDENQELRARLQQAQHSLGMPAESPDAGWASSASIMRTPISNAGLPMMSQLQLQTNVPSQARHDATGSHLAGWQDTNATFGSPTSLRRGGPSPTTYHSDMSSLASGSGARRDTMSPVGPGPSAGSGSNPVAQAVDYPYRSVVGQQYAPIQDTVAHHGQHHMGGDTRMSGIHPGSTGMASYATPAQQHAPAPASAAAPVQHHHHGQPQQQQHQPQPQSQHSRPQSQSQQTPQYMPYHASPPGTTSHPQQAPQSHGQISHSGFTAQNTPHQHPQHQQQQHPHGQPHQEQHQQRQQQQQQQQQQPLYYNAPGYGH